MPAFEVLKRQPAERYLSLASLTDKKELNWQGAIGEIQLKVYEIENSLKFN